MTKDSGLVIENGMTKQKVTLFKGLSLFLSNQKINGNP